MKNFAKKAGLLLAAAIALCGCEKPDETFRLLWRDGEVPGQLIARFGEQTAAKPVVETYASDEELVAKLSAKDKNYDLVQAEDHAVQALANQGRLRRLDHSEIPNLRNIAPEFLELPFDPGAVYSAPFMAGFVGIVYNAETVTVPIVGFSDVFRPQHAGRIVVGGDAREIASCAILAAGIPINEAGDDNLAKISPLLAAWIPGVKVFDPPDPKAALLEGDADIGIVRSGDAAQLFAANPRFQWVLPAEGVRMFVTALAIPKSARHADAAEALINFLLRPESGKALSDEFAGFNPNAEARKLLGEAQLENPASYPAGLGAARREMFGDIGVQAAKIKQLVAPQKTP